MPAKTFNQIKDTEIKKFNPYHGEHGRFSSANAATSMTFRTKDPNKQYMADMAAARAKQNAAGGSSGSQKTRGHREEEYRFSDGDEFYGAVQQDTGCTPEEAIQMGTAIKSFSDGGYHAIKLAQRGNPEYAYKEQQADALESYIEKSPKWGNSGALYRGAHFKRDEATEMLKKLQNGEEIEWGGTSSWTSDAKMAKHFSKDAGDFGDPKVIFILKNGTQQGTSIRHLSEHPGEDEVLISKKQRARATRITAVPRIVEGEIYLERYVVELEEV